MITNVCVFIFLYFFPFSSYLYVYEHAEICGEGL